MQQPPASLNNTTRPSEDKVDGDPGSMFDAVIEYVGCLRIIGRILVYYINNTARFKVQGPKKKLL